MLLDRIDDLTGASGPARCGARLLAAVRSQQRGTASPNEGHAPSGGSDRAAGGTGGRRACDAINPGISAGAGPSVA